MTAQRQRGGERERKGDSRSDKMEKKRNLIEWLHGTIVVTSGGESQILSTMDVSPRKMV